jgi:RNA polymerase sigma-70 factor (ECF subfamily)
MQRDLVERAMTGDHDAFSELARVSVGRLLVIARLILHDEASAEDATQEALVAAWRHIRGLRDPDRFDAWMHRLLVNECHREARGRQRLGKREVHLAAFDAPEPDSVGHLLDRDQLDRGFRRLDVDQRVVLVLTTGLRRRRPPVLGLPPGTVRSQLHRAMQACRTALLRTRTGVGEGGKA